MSLAGQISLLTTRIGQECKSLWTAVNGKAAAVHTHVATTDLTATGTKDTTTFLRGDNTWATPAGGGGTSGANYTVTTEYAEGTQPASPATGLTLFTRTRARDIPAFVNPQGDDVAVQAHLAFNRVCRWTAINNSAVPVGDGMGVTVATGATAVASASTNFFTSLSRVAYPVASSTTAASLAGFRGAQPQWFLSSTANMGGFYAVWRVGIGTSAAGSRGFVGFSTTTSSLAAGSDPSTLLNQFGFGLDAASTNWYFIASGATAGTKVDLGVNFPAKTSATDFFEFSLYAPSGGGSKVFWSARRLNDGAVASGSNTTTLPALSTLMVPHVHYTNGTSAANAVMHFQSLYIETDN